MALKEKIAKSIPNTPIILYNVPSRTGVDISIETIKTEDNLIDYGYKSIAPITEEEKLSIFSSDDFFSNLRFKSDFLKVLNKYSGKVKFIITTKGTEENLKKKKEWVKDNKLLNSIESQSNMRNDIRR